MDDDQQFCLRWNNHQSTLISVFDTLLENETLVDCTLAAEGKFLKAHKVVLSACSPYFATLLQEQYDKHPIFILKDVKYQELRAMMDYMYRGEVNISQDQLAALLKAAESLQIKGLSDNRSGSTGGIPPKPDHHRGGGGIGVGGGSNVVPTKLSAGYTLEQTKRARIGPSSMDSQDMSGSREGSSSPSRRRRKVRRRSIENVMTEVHDNSNSSQIQANQASSILLQQQQQQQQQQSNASLLGVGAITAAASALAASQIPPALSIAGTSAASSTVASNQATTQQQLTTSVTKKTESVKLTTATATSGGVGSDAINTADNIQGAVGGADEQDAIMDAIPKVEKQNHKQKSVAAIAKDVTIATTELVIEPKSEYDDEGNDETVEDLTLDDEDMGMDDLDHNAGTSQGGEGSSQGYAPWQHDRSQDELLLATQEAQQRDPQVEFKYEFHSSLVLGDRFPCAVCGKSYLRKRHLQRHMRDECIGIPPRFSCDLCPSRFRRKYHMVRHLTSKHGIPPAIAQQTTGGGVRAAGGAAAGGGDGSCGSGSQNGCDSPIPENLSLKKEKFELENVHSPLHMINGGGGGAAAGGGVAVANNNNNINNNNMCISPIPAVLPPQQPLTYGLTGAITAITAAAAVVEECDNRKSLHAHDIVDDTETSSNLGVAIKTEPEDTPTKAAALALMNDDWKMKLSLQLISNSLLKERLMNSMPFAYNNN